MKYLVTTFRLSGDNIDESLRTTAFDLISGLSGSVGYESFEEEGLELKGYIQEQFYNAEALDTVLSPFPLSGVTVSYSTSEAEYRDWNTDWESEGFEPIVLPGLCVVHDLKHPVEVGPSMSEILIDAHMAFGTGTHATTQMMLTGIFESDLSGKRVLDCGCGTGILSIASMKCGASEVVAYDIDEWSVSNTRHNVELNNVSEIEVLQGDISVLSHVSGVFDFVLANINRNILLSDMKYMKDAMCLGGHLLLSGFYPSDIPILCEEASRLGLTLQSKMESDGWAMLSFVL